MSGKVREDYNPVTQTLEWRRNKSFTDNDTGEIILVDEIAKRRYGSKQFWKCYLMDFLAVLGIFDSKQLDVFIYIVENTNQATNIFLGTQNKIAKDLNVSRPTVARMMKKLQEYGFIKRVQNGAYMVNPNILMKGNDHKRQILLTYYREEEPIDRMTFSRTARKEIETVEEQECIKNGMMISTESK